MNHANPTQLQTVQIQAVPGVHHAVRLPGHLQVRLLQVRDDRAAARHPAVIGAAHHQEAAVVIVITVVAAASPVHAGDFNLGIKEFKNS